MGFLSTLDNTATIGTSEYSILAGTTTGVPTSQTTEAVIEVVLDLSALAAGDQFKLTYYEKAVSGGTQRTLNTFTFTGAVFPPHQVMDPMHLKHGYDITLQKIVGTDRSIGMSARRVG